MAMPRAARTGTLTSPVLLGMEMASAAILVLLLLHCCISPHCCLLLLLLNPLLDHRLHHRLLMRRSWLLHRHLEFRRRYRHGQFLNPRIRVPRCLRSFLRRIQCATPGPMSGHGRCPLPERNKFLFRTFEEGQSDDLFAVLHRVQLSKGGQLFEPQFTA